MNIVAIDHERSTGLGDFVVTGTFPDLEAARQWVDTLKRKCTWSDQEGVYVDTDGCTVFSFNFLSSPADHPTTGQIINSGILDSKIIVDVSEDEGNAGETGAIKVQSEGGIHTAKWGPNESLTDVIGNSGLIRAALIAWDGTNHFELTHSELIERGGGWGPN